MTRSARSGPERPPAVAYDRAIEALKSGTAAEWEALALELADFPDGVDSFLGRRWIINALHLGSKGCIDWMLSRGVDLAFRDEEGYTPVHAALVRESDDRLDVLDGLLAAGAPVNLKGLNDWTPAHMAAARDDVEALGVLVRRGADLTIRTDIDDHATPLEEARNLGKARAVAYLDRGA